MTFIFGMAFGMILDPIILVFIVLFWLYPKQKGG